MPPSGIPTSGRLTVRVDDDLLEFCNQAYGEAERRGARCVEIAHVVWCLTAAAGSSRWFDGVGLQRLALATAVTRWLAGADREAPPAALQASGDLKALLTRTENIAKREARDFAGSRDFLTALAEQSSDLRSAAFAHVGVGPRAQYGNKYGHQFGAQFGGPGGSMGNRAAPPMEQFSADADRQAPRPSPPGREICRDPNQAASARALARPDPSPRDPQAPVFRPHSDVRREPMRPAATGTPARPRYGEQLKLPFVQGAARVPGIEALLERMAQQEHDIDELRSLTARLLDRRGGDANAREASTVETSAEYARADEAAGAKRSGEHAREGSTHDERARERSWNFRARLRVRAGGWTMREHARTTEVAGTRTRAGTKAGTATGSKEQASPAVAARPVEGEHGRRRQRDARPLGSHLAEPVHALPDNDAGDEAEGTGDRLKRFYLSPDDDIVKAPSIGPRTAARLGSAGLMLVRDLLCCDPIEVATLVGARYMTADRIGDWKAQARLVCTIPWLRGTHAQLLVGAGFDTIGKLVRADASVVCAAILRFAATREGQSILRTGPAPEIDRIACWIENTALAEPARAA